MKSRAVSRVMSTLLLIGVHSILLLSIFAITPVESQEWWTMYVPSPEQVALAFWTAGKVAYVNVTIQFYIPCFDITDWGTVTEIGHNIWVDSEIWLWTGICILMVPPPISHTYELGPLESGNYTFTFKAWNYTIKSIDFTITDYEPVHNLNTSLNYTSIQEAIDANETLDGHTILVDAGTYYENVIVNKSVSLIGENKYSTVIDADSFGNVIGVTASNVNVTGFTIQKSGTVYLGCGICVHDGSDGNNISDNIIADNYCGIYLDNSNYNVVSGNNIFDNSYGITLYSQCNNNTISGNKIADSTWSGIELLGSSDHNIVCGNNITNNGAGIWFNRSANNSVSGNNIENNHEGISLTFSSNNSIHRNYIARNGDGVEQSYSNCNSILENDVLDNKGDGIHLQCSLENSIHGNHVTNNSHGNIMLADSSNNTISGNNVRNSSIGIGLYGQFYDASNNSIYGNNLVQNGYGIFLFGDVEGNSFYHNNLVNNTQQINIETKDFTNFWDNGFEGNYWNEYDGIDANQDGIGDSPYAIDANNQDSYPLMGMFSDFNATSKYHVQTICNSSISDFQFNGTAICFNVTGENDTTGFCRICIPTSLMNETYKVFVNGTEVSYDLLPCSNSTHSYLYFTYSLSTQEVIVIPEFPSFLILPLFMIATLVAVILYRRKHST